MIKDLPINTNGKLTGDVKKELVRIVEQEFSNKDSLYHHVSEAEKRKIMEAYKDSVSFDTLRKEYNKAEMRRDVAVKAIEDANASIEAVGLTTDGEVAKEQYYDNGHYKTNYKAVALKKKLADIEANAPSQTLKSKLITRLMLSTTVGEANEIMREVLGNGIIPATDIKAITFEG